jgi:hypothetical protein
MMIDSLGGRRFLTTIGCGLITSLLQWFGKLDPAGTTFSVVIGCTVAVFIAGRTVDQFKPTPKE